MLFHKSVLSRKNDNQKTPLPESLRGGQTCKQLQCTMLIVITETRQDGKGLWERGHAGGLGCVGAFGVFMTNAGTSLSSERPGPEEHSEKNLWETAGAGRGQKQTALCADLRSYDVVITGNGLLLKNFHQGSDLSRFII